MMKPSTISTLTDQFEASASFAPRRADGAELAKLALGCVVGGAPAVILALSRCWV